jgi:hypothetical protein
MFAGRAHAECKPAAVAQGDPALVVPLIAKLTASGIATTSAAGCPVVQVNLEQRGLQVHVKLADGFQRTGERDVQDVATAAAIVESWTYQEIEAGTLPAESVVATSAPAVAPPSAPRLAVAAGVMSALGTNGGTTWIGGSLGTCVRIGSWCPGALARVQADTTATGDSSSISQDAYALSALATIDRPIELGGFVLSPGIGVGYAYLHVTTHHHNGSMPLDVPTSDHELCAGAHAALWKPLGTSLAVFADLWTEAAPLRSDAQFGPTGSLLLSLGLRIAR